MDELRWSQWYPLAQQSLSVPVPDVPGIYEIRTDHEFGRLRGQSRIVYIGSAARGNSPSLRKRLLGQHISNPNENLCRAGQLLRQAGYSLEFRFATSSDGKTAEHMEARRLVDYEKEHWELPPGNAAFPRAYYKIL
jgi:hypothetical protein